MKNELFTGEIWQGLLRIIEVYLDSIEVYLVSV